MTALIVVVLAVLLISVCLTISGFLLMWAWNLVAPVFWPSAPHITFWMAVAINVILSAIGGAFRAVVSTKE